MNRLVIRSLFCAALYSFSFLGLAVADGGHNHGSRKGNGGSFGPRVTPFESRGGLSGQHNGPSHGPDHHDRLGHTPGRFCPIDPRGGRVTFRRDRKPRDLRTLAFQLEFAAEIVWEEIRFEFPHTRFTEQLLTSAAEIEKQAQHFRISVDNGTEAGHLGQDFETVTASFANLARPLNRIRGSLLIDRAMFRVDSILADIANQLKESGNIPTNQPAGPPVPPVNRPQQPTEQRPIIPKEAKGIALLPVADQAAALAQRTCPVTGDLLGADGKPLKVQVAGRTVFVCCEGCVDDIKANPKAYLTKTPAP